MDRKSLAAAFPVTVPVLVRRIIWPSAWLISHALQAIGYNFIWAFFAESEHLRRFRTVSSGVSLLSSAAALSTVAVMTLLINFRHLVKGLSMLENSRAWACARVLHDLFPHG